MIEISADTVKNIFSSYLDSFSKENIRYENIQINENSIILNVDVLDAENYHLSAIMAQVLISQAGIIYINTVNQIALKDREILLSKFELHCSKPILHSKIILELILVETKISNRFIHYVFDFNIENGKFNGSIIFVFPKDRKFKL